MPVHQPSTVGGLTEYGLTAAIADSRIYTRQYLDAAVERYRRHYHGFFWDKLLLGAARLLR